MRTTILLFTLLLSVNLYAQFDSVIFSKGMSMNYERHNIVPLGDQNKDGFDDILLYDCSKECGFVYFGGNPMDTVPAFVLPFFDSVNNYRDISAIDLNGDGIKDIVITTRKLLIDIGYFAPGDIRVFYGGSKINTKPDLIFNMPEGASDNIGSIYILNDFNGDGRQELVIYDPNLPKSDLQYGTLYFYNTESKFDTIPHHTMQGDSVKKIWLQMINPGDINGDGKADFSIYGTIGDYGSYRFYRSFYLGNENFELKPAVTFYRDEHPFTEYMNIINDVNGDGRDDILTLNYGKYPFYYHNAILYGSFPIDTIPDVGLNTQNLATDFGAIYSLGDVNGDGFNDFISNTMGGLYPGVKLWLGGKNMPGTIDDVANKTWFGNEPGFGRQTCNIGDVDGDKVNDFVIVEIPYGYMPDMYCNDSRVYIFKGDTSVITSVKETGKILPEQFNIGEAYPNPFNPETVIKYELKSRAKAEIKVFNALGQEVKTLLNEEKEKGEYSLSVNLNGYSSGTYFVRFSFTADNNSSIRETKKIVLLK